MFELVADFRPAAPDWFDHALAARPEVIFVDVAGCPIETLCWGERGKPGLLFVHGNGAQAWWWSFIAPFFAADYRVAALSWSGMGGSGWREHYSLDLFVAELLTCAQAAGLTEGQVKEGQVKEGPVKPIVVGHSFGGYPLMACGARHGDKLGAAVIVDSPIWTAEQRAVREKTRRRREPRESRVYASLDEALSRFRFLPEQPCENLYIVDHIARTSLKEVPARKDRPAGWSWRFDPFMWRDYDSGSPPDDLARMTCPVGFMWGARSAMITPDVLAHTFRILPPGARAIEIPEARHHVMIDQPLAFVAGLRGMLAGWGSPPR